MKVISYSKLPKKFGKYVRTGQFKRARWFLDNRQRRIERKRYQLDIANQLRNRTLAEQQRSAIQAVGDRFQNFFGLGGLGGGAFR